MRSPEAMRIRVLAALATLGALWFSLPVALPGPSTGPASAECLTLPDTPPDLTRTDRIPAFERCVRLNPNDVELMADLGRLYEAADRAANAEEIYRRALVVDPGYADVRLRLGRLLLKHGDAAGARTQAAAALAVQPNRRALRDLLHDARGE